MLALMLAEAVPVRTRLAVAVWLNLYRLRGLSVELRHPGWQRQDQRAPPPPRQCSHVADAWTNSLPSWLSLDPSQKALISHNTPQAITLYSRALLLPPQPSPAAALALGNLLSRGPDDRHLQIGAKTRIKKRREWEAMNKAGGAYLVGLAGELDRAGLWGSGHVDHTRRALNGKSKAKGKDKQPAQKSTDGEDSQAEHARQMAALENAVSKPDGRRRSAF